MSASERSYSDSATAEHHPVTRSHSQSLMAAGGLLVACAACCVLPLGMAAGIGTGTALAAFVVHPPVEAILAVGFAAGGVLLFAIMRRERLKVTRAAVGGLTVTERIVCRLPPADRAQRTADFRALFSGGLVERQRTSESVRWTLRTAPGVEEESRRLAALEERCCDGITFEIRRDGDLLHWDIAGPTAAAATLDVLFDLPLKVMSNEGADAIWRALDAAGCGPSASVRS
jgi:hypothetical protein